MYPQNNNLGFGDPATIATIGVALFQIGQNIFGQKISPEAQAQKAGVWGAMLAEVLGDQGITGQQLASTWRDQLPFSQASTKDRFVRLHLIGKDRESIINHLVQKINDELRKGGMPTKTRQELEANFARNTALISESDIVPNFPGDYGLPQSQYYSTPDQYPGVQQASIIPGVDQKTMLIAGGILAAGALGWYLLKGAK